MAEQNAAEVKTGQNTQQVQSGAQQGAVPGVSNKGAFGTTLGNTDQPLILKGSDVNVLHNYRSWNYVFTLSALEDKALTDPQSYEQSSQKFIIAKSSGKGSAQITNKLSTSVINNTTTNYNDVVNLINGFNKESPGRFDFVIENVKIAGLMAFSKEAGTSLPLKITFDVIEPYSMGGFLQALSVASQATGALTYPAGHFVFKLEFYGYNDKNTGPDGSPELIPNSTRYYPILITGVTVETTDKGTTYHVTCSPVEQKTFGEASKLKSDLKMKGETVGEILKDMMDGLNKAIAEEAEKTKGPENRNRDQYEIYFAKPEAPGTTNVSMKNGRTPEWTETGSIYNAKINQGLRGNQIPAMATPDAPNPGPGYVGQENKTKTPAADDKSIKYEPGTNQTSFPQGSHIHEIIEAVIRDSEYTKDIIKNLDQVKKGDGMITYFMVRTEVEVLEGTPDLQSLAKNKLHRFVVVPYKMHYTRLPGEQLGIADFKGIKTQIKRTYDYLFMGKNKDVINFYLKFNNLYFQSIPPRTGETDASGTSKGAGAANTQELQAPKADAQTVKDNKNPTAKIITIPEGFVPANGLTGQARQTTPYHQLAQTMHNAIVQSVDLATCNIDIYGDPYYLVTGGIGNQTHALADNGITKNGEAPINAGEVYINVNWKTPVDYNTFEKGGSIYFDAEILPFSGIYKVTEVSSDFAAGTFKQTLKLLRMPGQLVEAKKVSPTDSGFKAKPKPGEQQVKDIAPVGVQTSGTRPNDFQISSLLRGLPDIGSAGSIPNFVNAAGGGIAGAIGLVTGGLNSIAGVGGAVQNLVGQVKTIAPQLGINVGSSLNGIDSLAQGIRLSTSGIANVVGGVSKLAPAAVASVNNIVSGVLPTANSSAVLATGVVDQVTNAGGSASVVSSLASKLSGAAVDLVNQVKGQADGLLNSASAAVASITRGIPTVDPTALAAKVGIDPAQLSGIDPSIQSKILGQLQDLENNIPDNVDLNAFKGQGLVMANLTKDNIANLPPLQNEQVVSTNVNDAITKAKTLAAEATALGDANKLSGVAGFSQFNNLGQAASGLTQGLGSTGITALTDKLTAAQSGLNNLVGSTLNVSNGVSGLLPSQAGLGAVESNISAVRSMVQSGSSDLANTAAEKFGSLRATSPLDTLVASTNKGNVNNGWGEG